MARCTKSVAKLERLMSAYDAWSRLDVTDDGTVTAAQAIIRAQNVLIDACVDCGMPHDGDEFAFAARHVTRFLCAA